MSNTLPSTEALVHSKQSLIRSCTENIFKEITQKINILTIVFRENRAIVSESVFIKNSLKEDIYRVGNESVLELLTQKFTDEGWEVSKLYFEVDYIEPTDERVYKCHFAVSKTLS